MCWHFAVGNESSAVVVLFAAVFRGQLVSLPSVDVRWVVCGHW